MAKYDFSNALVLVTGAGSGIGRGAAKAFADSGAKVIVADINLDSAVETVEGLQNKASHFALKVDVSHEKSILELASSITSKYGRSPSVVIHAAGIGIVIGARRSIFDISHDEWNKIIGINLTGTFLINQIFGRRMRDEKISNGAIVNFSSTTARIPEPNVADYCATKAGVISLTQNFAHELAPFQIRVNAAGPGWIDTPLLDPVPKHILEEGRSKIPRGQFGTVEEVARLCLFLASTESSHITGQTIWITGGV